MKYDFLTNMDNDILIQRLVLISKDAFTLAAPGVAFIHTDHRQGCQHVKMIEH